MTTDSHSCRLACTVGAKQSSDLSLKDVQGHLVQGLVTKRRTPRVVNFAEIVDGDADRTILGLCFHLSA